MSDPESDAIAEPAAQEEICDEIGRVVGSIWQRRGGVRPSAVRTEVDGDVIRCVIEEGEADEDAPEGASTESNAYRHEATSAVSRITKRSVSAFINKRDAKTGVATQTFILERVRTKY